MHKRVAEADKIYLDLGKKKPKGCLDLILVSPKSAASWELWSKNALEHKQVLQNP